jgi:hypothetical protein
MVKRELRKSLCHYWLAKELLDSMGSAERAACKNKTSV